MTSAENHFFDTAYIRDTPATTTQEEIDEKESPTLEPEKDKYTILKPRRIIIKAIISHDTD